MVAPASERSVPCGVCQAQVPESHFRSGRARLYQDVLYCIACTSAAEKARVETTAFKQQLTKGFYACAKCESPMSAADIEAKSVVFFQGNLYCRECSRDLRSILRPRGAAAISTRQSAVFNSQASGVGIGTGTSSPSRRFSPSQIANVASGTGAVSGMGTVSGRQQALQGPPCHLCDKPAVAVPGQPLPLEYQGHTYCGACRREIDSMIARSQEDLARISTFECQRCHAQVRARDVIEGRAVRYQGQILCDGCSKDVGGRSASSLEVPLIGGPKKPIPTAPPPNTPCARCERTIPGLDIRLGKALERDGKLFCAKCKVELEAALERLEKKAAKTVQCSHCGRAITPKEIREKKLASHEGQLFCHGCSRDPAKILLGHSSDEQAVGKCRMCGTPIGAGARGECSACQAKVQNLQQESLAKSGELATSALSYPCDSPGCQSSITEQDLESGKAIIVGDRSFCPSCAEKQRPKKAAARCARCRKALEPGAAPGSFCPACAEKSAEDAADMESALKLSSEFTLRCAQCQRAVQASELESGKAVTVQGKLVCSNCRYKQPKAAPAAAPGKKPCATCDGALGGAGVPYGDKRICAACQGVLENLLAASQMPATVVSPCKACKKPAKGEGALLVEGQPFCKSCRKAADFLILYTVRARRAKGARPGGSKLPVLLALGSAVAVGVIGWGIFSNRDRSATVKVHDDSDSTVARPRVTKESEDAPPALPPLARAQQLARTPARTFEQAQTIVAEIEKLRADSKDSEIDALLARAIATRNAFSYGIAQNTLTDAQAAAKASKLEEAIQILGRFPPDLLQTEAGRDVQRLKEKYQALQTCLRDGNALLTAKAPDSYVAIDRLLQSPEAKLCGFPESDLGQQLDALKTVLRNEALQRGQGPPKDRLSAPDAVARAKAQEQKGSLANAESFYAQALEADPDCVDALVGRCRIALESDRPKRAAPYLERLKRLAPKRPDVLVAEGWLALAGRDPAGYERARSAIAGLSDKELGPRGRTLAAILALGAPTARRPHLVVIGDADPQAVALADDCAQAMTDVFGLDGGDERLLVIAFRDPDARSAFFSKVGRAVNEDGRLPGCLGVALLGPTSHTLMDAVAHALAARTDAPPAWLVAMIPVALRHEPPVPPNSDVPPAPFTDVERARTSELLASPPMLLTAYKRAVVALDNGKRDVLAAYVSTRRLGDAKRASKELEASLAPLLR